MLVFSAITPHPPILIPAIGKKQLKKIGKTKKAMEGLAWDLFSANPDVLIVISPHSMITPNAFTVNLNDRFNIDFENFGDFSVKLEFSGDISFFSAYKESINKKIALNIISQSVLDHGAGVPLYYLGQNLEKIRILPISFSLLDHQTHFEFGKALRQAIIDTDKKIAVIASGDLSHCLTDTAPSPYNPAGREFDNQLIKSLKQQDSYSIINFDSELIEGAAECGLKSILILLGILDKTKFQTKILSYEAPFGVGYLVVNFKLK